MTIKKYDWKSKVNKTQQDAIGKIPGLSKVLDSMQKEINDGREQRQIEQDAKIDTGLGDRFNMLQQRLTQAETAMRDFTGQGYGLDDSSSPMMAGITKAIEVTDTFLGSAREGAVAMDRLASATPTEQFEQMSAAIGASTGELAANAATLAKLGLSYGSFAKNLDLMTYSFNQPIQSVKTFNQELFNFARSVGQLPSLVSKNFQMVASSLAYSFPKIQNEFMKIQQMSAKTGVSVSKLMGTFGEQTDTISGASSFAAGINTIIGKNVFSATEILMMSEAERMEATRKALKDSQIYKDYMSGDEKLKKFALRAISGKLRMSTDETRRFLDGDAGDDTLKGRMAANVDSKFKAVNDTMAAEGRQFTSALKGLTKSIEENADLIAMRRMTPLERDKLMMRRDLSLSLRDASRPELGKEMRDEVFTQRFRTRYRLPAAQGGVTRTDPVNLDSFVNEMYKAQQGDNQELFQLMDRAMLLRMADPVLDDKFPNPKNFKKNGKLDISRYTTALRDFQRDAMKVRGADDARISAIEMSVIQDVAGDDPLREARLMRVVRERRAAEARDKSLKRKEFIIKKTEGGKTTREFEDAANLMGPTASTSKTIIPGVASVPGQDVDNTVAVVLNFEGITIKGLAKMVASAMNA